MSISRSNSCIVGPPTHRSGRNPLWITALAAICTAAATGPLAADAPPRVVKFQAIPNPLKPAQWPILGSPEAAIMLVELFDYTCGSCQQMGAQVGAARKKYGERLGVVVLPVVLDGHNKEKSRQLARLSVSVFLADRTKFPEFHEWLITGPTDEDARKRATELIGAETLHAQLADPRVDQYLDVIQQLYVKAGKGKVPLLSSERFSLRGVTANEQQLFQSIDRNHPGVR